MKETFQALCSRLKIPLWKGMEIGKYVKGSELDKMELYNLILNGSIKLLEHLKVEVCIKNSITIATAQTIISARDKKRGVKL